MAWHLDALMQFNPEDQFMRWVSNTQSYISRLKTTVCISALDHFPELQDQGSMPYRTLAQAMRVPGFRLPGFRQAPPPPHPPLCDLNRPFALTLVAAKITATPFCADCSKPGSGEPAHACTRRLLYSSVWNPLGRISSASMLTPAWKSRRRSSRSWDRNTCSQSGSSSSSSLLFLCFDFSTGICLASRDAPEMTPTAPFASIGCHIWYSFVWVPHAAASHLARSGLDLALTQDDSGPN
jgi:hypothetical protein